MLPVILLPAGLDSLAAGFTQLLGREVLGASLAPLPPQFGHIDYELDLLSHRTSRISFLRSDGK
jgi:hypothetical protein